MRSNISMTHRVAAYIERSVNKENLFPMLTVEVLWACPDPRVS